MAQGLSTCPASTTRSGRDTGARQSYPQGSTGDRSGIGRPCSGLRPTTVTSKAQSALLGVAQSGEWRSGTGTRCRTLRCSTTRGGDDQRVCADIPHIYAKLIFNTSTRRHTQPRPTAPPGAASGRKQKSPPKRGNPRPVLKLQLPYNRPSTTESAFSNFLGPPRRTVKFDVAGSRIEDTLMSRNSAANAAPTQRRATSDSVAPPQDLRPTP